MCRRFPRPSGVKQAATGCYHTSLRGIRELRHHFTRKGCENASVWDGGQRQHSSQMPHCNGADTAKAARVSHTKWLSTNEVGKADDGGLAHWCAPRSVTTRSPNQSRVAQLESGVPGNWPAPFGAGERPRGPTYRYYTRYCGALAAADGQAVGPQPWMLYQCSSMYLIHRSRGSRSAI